MYITPNVIEKTETNLDTIKINDNYFYAVYDSSGYKYSIINENNEPELTTSPEDATKIHYISENEKPHLEKIVEESYKCYKLCSFAPFITILSFSILESKLFSICHLLNCSKYSFAFSLS